MSCEVRFVDQDWVFVEELKTRCSADTRCKNNIYSSTRLAKPIFHSLGPRLRYVLRISRLKQSLSINDLARRIGVTREELVAVEEGNEYPSQDLIKLLETELSVELVKKS